MSVVGLSGSASYLSALLRQQRTQIEDLSVQLTTGKKTESFGGLGADGITSLKMRQEISTIDAYKSVSEIATTHITQLGKSLERIEKLRSETVSAINPNDYQLTTDGATTSQATTKILLLETISQLNTNVAGYNLYGGKVSESEPVASFDHIMNGHGGKLGLKDVMARFSSAHLGSDGKGKVNTAASDGTGESTVKLTRSKETPFGFKIHGGTASSSVISMNYRAADLTTDPANPVPAGLDIKLTGLPREGDRVQVELSLPDGSFKTLALSAKTTGTATASNFVISKNSNPAKARFETAKSLETAIGQALKTAGQTDLKAVAASQAGNEFFGLYEDGRSPAVPKLPDASGELLENANGKILGWYRGYTQDSKVRDDKIVEVDRGLKVGYGVRANEKPFAEQMKNLSVFIAADFKPTDEADAQSKAIAESYYNVLADKTDRAMAVNDSKISGVQSIATEISAAKTTINNSSERLSQRSNSYKILSGKIENVDRTQVAVELSEMTNNLQASYRMTSSLLNLSLSDYLKL
ncbi:hypothetical protein [Polycladidibacter stylochi]|uniref:hypothetical protein n=1 Tax=Polycladidibacter stylochi TaxID=1807766 RepID=UPI000836991E|nr:hypothetical protein [Pseudovibrio stylochi]